MPHSDVDFNRFDHQEKLNHERKLAFRRVASLIGPEMPIILETPVPSEFMEREIEMAQSILESAGDDDEVGVLVDGRNPPMKLGLK